MYPFNADKAVELEILDLAAELPGMTLGDIREVAGNKGGAGLAVEAFFGITPNSRSGPDFEGAAIELKVVPMVRRARGLGPKERTVITMIDYDALIDEVWEASHAWAKLKAVLFVFYEYVLGGPVNDNVVLLSYLWRPDEVVEGYLREDWERAKTLVAAGLAHELSESQGKILGACTKGPGGGRLRSQPNSPIGAKSRAFALKPSLTGTLYQQAIGSPVVEARLVRTERETFEHAVRRRLTSLVGRRVGDVAAEMGVGGQTSKSYAANVIRAAIGIRGQGAFREAEEFGMNFRMSRVGPTGMPYEAMSFRAVEPVDLVEQSWTDSDFLRQVEYLVITPAFGERRKTPAAECVIRESVIWTPAVDELAVMQAEWEVVVASLRRGDMEAIPSEKETRAIHFRPHAKDATATYEVPGVGQVPKRSLWLNRSWVRNIVETGSGIG